MWTVTLIVSLATSAPSGGERFAPITTRNGDYRALRDVARVVLEPSSTSRLEDGDLTLCAFGKDMGLTCLGALSGPTRMGAPCFGPPGSPVSDPDDPIVDLALEPWSCAVTRSGRLFCAAPLTSPMLSPAGGADAAPVAFDANAALYADRTLRTRRDDLPLFSAARPIVGGPETLVAMSSTTPDALCLLGADGHVHCTDWDSQNDRSEADPDGPIHFERVGAPRKVRGLGPYEPCAERPCDDALTGAVQLASAGLYETCARLSDGEVACWQSPRMRPHRLPRFNRPQSIAASRSGVCAVTAKRQVECLGFDALDEVGDDWVVEPVALVPGLTDVKSVVLSREALCAVTHKGTVDCRHLRSRPEAAEADGPDLDGDDADPRYRHDADQPAVAIIPWTRDLVVLGFAGTWTDLDEELSPLIGVTRAGRLLGAKPPVGAAPGGPELVPGLPCMRLGGAVHCRRIADSGEHWEPWREVRTSAGPGRPWWLGLPWDAVSPDEPLTRVTELGPLVSRSGLSPVELVGWEGIPCLRFAGGEVRCGRRGPRGVELVSVPAPLPGAATSGFDLCGAYIARQDGPASDELRGVIDLDGSHRTLCALRDNGEIACWGDLSRLRFEGLEGELGGPADRAAAVLAERHYAPRVLATVPDAVELAVTPSFVCARTRVGEVHCVGEAGRGRAPGRWGGFGAKPRKPVGLTGLTHLATLPGYPLACGFVSAGIGPRPEDRPSGRPSERSDPRDAPAEALAEALAAGQAVCWGDDEALRFLNATFLGRPKRR